MALKSGRVGVAPDQVDVYGNVKAAGSGSNMEIRVNEDDQPQWRKKGTEEWQNFSGGGGLGWNVPPELLSAEGITNHDGTLVEGGMYVDGSIVYVDIKCTVINTSQSSYIFGGFPAPNTSLSDLFLCIQNDDTKVIRDIAYQNGNLRLGGGSMNGGSFRLFGMYLKL